MGDDIIFEEKPPELPEIQVVRRTLEEQKKENVETSKTSWIIKLFRVFNDNKDLALILLSALIVCSFGFLFCRIYLSMSIIEIQLVLADFLSFLLLLISGLGSVFAQVLVEKGKISRRLSGSVQKECDLMGNTSQPKKV